MMGTSINGHRSTSLKGLSMENVVSADPSQPVSPAMGQVPQSRTQLELGHVGSVAGHQILCQLHPSWSGCSWTEPVGPSPNPLPWGHSCPQPWAPCPKAAQPISHSNNLQSATLAKPGACCVPVMCQLCACHVPARMGAELLRLLCCTGQLKQQNRSRNSPPARPNLSPHHLAPQFCPRLRFWESRGG